MANLLKLAGSIALLIGSQYLLVKYKEPQAVWLYCEILELCEPELSAVATNDKP